jgi:hypothetical protein
VAPDAGDAAAWGARLLEHAACAWSGSEDRVQRLAEVVSAPEAHLPAAIAMRDALAAGEHHIQWHNVRVTRLLMKPTAVRVCMHVYHCIIQMAHAMACVCLQPCILLHVHLRCAAWRSHHIRCKS